MSPQHAAQNATAASTSALLSLPPRESSPTTHQAPSAAQSCAPARSPEYLVRQARAQREPTRALQATWVAVRPWWGGGGEEADEVGGEVEEEGGAAGSS